MKVPEVLLEGNNHQPSGPVSGWPGRKNRTMKHLLSILTVAFACATTAMADEPVFSYKVNTIPYTNQFYQGYSGSFFSVEITEGHGKLYIVDFLNNTGSPNQTDSIRQQGITEYGYYDVSDTEHANLHSNPVEGNAVPLDPYTYSDNGTPTKGYRYGYELGTFSAGDKVEIYVSNGIDSVSSNTGIWYRNFSRYDTGWSVDSLDSSMKVAELTLWKDVNHSQSTQLRFGFYGVGTLSDSIGGGSGTVGAPLPGGLQIALIAGLFGLGFWYVRRRKTSVA